jgi:membrane protein YdbS with pleckstrin-like domain
MRTITEIWKVMSTILLIIVILLLIGALPSWPYSRGWGYYPSGGLGLILVIVLILAVLGRL